MKYIDRSQVDEPENLRGQVAPTEGEKIKKSIYGHTDVKSALNHLQHGICCYCESRFSDACPGDVEHFRPKQGFQQNENDELHQPGYYWLAYRWDNLMYSCEHCNRYYKHNYFPLRNPDNRFNPATCDISAEEPLLINPYEEQHPEVHITFDGIKIRPLTDKGDASITYYGLYRKELNEPRQEILNDITSFVDIADLSNGTDNEGLAKEKLKNYILQKIANGQQTLMIRCNFGEYL